MTLDLRERGGVLLVAVRVKPRSRSGVSLTQHGLVVAVAAAPIEGRANEEARRVLASALGVPPSAVELHAGPRARSKVFAVIGLDLQTARTRLLAAAT